MARRPNGGADHSVVVPIDVDHGVMARIGRDRNRNASSHDCRDHDHAAQHGVFG